MINWSYLVLKSIFSRKKVAVGVNVIRVLFLQKLVFPIGFKGNFDQCKSVFDIPQIVLVVSHIFIPVSYSNSLSPLSTSTIL